MGQFEWVLWIRFCILISKSQASEDKGCEFKSCWKLILEDCIEAFPWFDASWKLKIEIQI